MKKSEMLMGMLSLRGATKVMATLLAVLLLGVTTICLSLQRAPQPVQAPQVSKEQLERLHLRPLEPNEVKAFEAQYPNEAKVIYEKPFTALNPDTGIYESACRPGYILTYALDLGDKICRKEGDPTPGAYGADETSRTYVAH